MTHESYCQDPACKATERRPKVGDRVRNLLRDPLLAAAEAEGRREAFAEARNITRRAANFEDAVKQLAERAK